MFKVFHFFGSENSETSQDLEGSFDFSFLFRVSAEVYAYHLVVH